MKSAARRVALATGLCLIFSGCRCWPGFNRYHDVIDGVSDFSVRWEKYYDPRFDISRAGKPDWCCRVNSAACPCRCQQGYHPRIDPDHVYPTCYPYGYPSQAVPPSGMILMPEAGATSNQLPSSQAREQGGIVPPPPELYETPLPRAPQPVPAVPPPPATPEAARRAPSLPLDPPLPSGTTSVP